MIGTSGRVNVFAYCEPIDMRKGYEGLGGIVREVLKREPLSGALFLFINRRRNRAKILYFDGTGLCILQKRMEKGRFVALWKFVDRNCIKLTKSELELFLAGSHLIGRFQVAPPPMSDKDLEVSPQI